MLNKLHLSARLVLLTIIVGLVPLQTASAESAEQYFADGNRLFRDDLYWAALLRYRQAADAGMNSDLLHYNIGVTHYRAGQHIRARESLLMTLDNPSLRLAAQYNLGLNAYELGDTDEALRWFRLARDQETDKKIQSYAVVAIARIRDELAEPDDFEIRVVEREEKRELTNLELHAQVGYGSIDNVFRSPATAYLDRSDPTRPVVVPTVQSGAFVPANFRARYLVNSLPFEGFFVSYRLSGRYFVDEELENANEYQHEASFGSEFKRKEGDRERFVFSAFKIAQHDETYFDPDDGTVRSVGGVAIGDRMSYLRYGPELTVRQSHQRLSIGATIKGQLWNYEEQAAVPEYDHEYMLLRLYGQYKFNGSSLLRITAEGYSRRYGDRPAFDLDGQQRVGNRNIRYDYYSLKLAARQRVFDSVWFGFDVERTERIDQYLGYNDYTRDQIGAEIHWTPGERFDLELRGSYRLYNYPNAFAFHDATVQRKTQESADARLLATFDISRHFKLVAEARYRETVSNDTRIQYEQNQYLLGLRWEL